MSDLVIRRGQRVDYIGFFNRREGDVMANEQKVLPGVDKTHAEKEESAKRFRDSLSGCMGLPGRATDTLAGLEGLSVEQLQGLLIMCRAVTPKIRLLSNLVAEMLTK